MGGVGVCPPLRGLVSQSRGGQREGGLVHKAAHTALPRPHPSLQPLLLGSSRHPVLMAPRQGLGTCPPSPGALGMGPRPAQRQPGSSPPSLP